jgi:hypothetical protein
LVIDIEKVKKNTADQDTTLANQDVKLDAILNIAKTTAKTLGHPKLRWLLIVCAALGALAGGTAAGWKAHEAKKTLAP